MESVSFKVPVNLIIGKVDGRLGIWARGRGLVLNGAPPGISYVEELNLNEGVRGHVALTAFGHMMIKAVDNRSSHGTYALDNASLTRLPAKDVVRFEDHSDWFVLRGSFLLLANPLSEGPYTIVCPYRIGESLVVNVGHSLTATISALVHAIKVINEFREVGSAHATCTCRLSLMPVELTVVRGDTYLVARIYLNDSVTPRTGKYLVIVAKGGNVVYRALPSDSSFKEHLNEAVDVLRNLGH